MRAARFHGPSEGLAIEDVPRPDPGPGEVLVSVEAAGLCHSDLHILHGDAVVPTPVTLGHENAGVVEETGAGVDIEVGTTVAVYGGWGCGHCRVCDRGEYQLCNLLEWVGIGNDGGFAEYVLVPHEEYLLPLGGLDPLEAAPLTDAALTPYRAVQRAREECGLTPADVVVCVGIGGLGQYGVQFASMTGARVVAVDIDSDALALADELGADATIDASNGRVPSRIRNVIERDGVTAAIDFVGVDDTLEWCADVLGSAGHLYLVGIGGGELPFFFNFLAKGEFTYSTVFWGSIDELRDVLQVAQARRLDVSVEPIGFDELSATFERLEHGDVERRAVLQP